MKRMLPLLLAFLLFLGQSIGASAQMLDLDSMSFDELRDLRAQIDLRMYDSKEYKEVTVPQGTYVVGVDIPEGIHKVTAYMSMVYVYEKFTALSSLEGMRATYTITDNDPIGKLELIEGDTIVVLVGGTVFSPYVGLDF